MHSLPVGKQPSNAMVNPQGKVLGNLSDSDAYSSGTRCNQDVADRGAEETDNKPLSKWHSGKVESTGLSRCFLLSTFACLAHATMSPWN